MSREEETPVFLTAAQVATRYGCSEKWPYHDKNMRLMARQIVGARGLRWKLSDLEAFEAGGSERADVLRYFRRMADNQRDKKVRFTLA
jgi:hypothetical protein